MRRQAKQILNTQLKTSQNFYQPQEQPDYLSPWKNWDEEGQEQNYIPTYRKQLLFEYKRKNSIVTYQNTKKQDKKQDKKGVKRLLHHSKKNKIKTNDKICKYIDNDGKESLFPIDYKEKTLLIKRSTTEVSGEELVLAGKQWEGIEGKKIIKPNKYTILSSKLGDEVVFISRSVDGKFNNQQIKFSFQREQSPLPQTQKKSRNPSKFFQKKKSQGNENIQTVNTLNLNAKSTKSISHNPNRKFAMTVETQVLRQLKQKLTTYYRPWKNSSHSLPCSRQFKDDNKAQEQQTRIFFYPKPCKSSKKSSKNQFRGNHSIYNF